MRFPSGPWKLEFDEHGGYDCMTAGWKIQTQNGVTLFVIDLGDFHQDEEVARAIAQLTHTAPELLKVLQEIVRVASQFTDVAALTGDPESRLCDMQIYRDSVKAISKATKP